MIIWLDFETRSPCPLPERGAYNYARDPDTEILTLHWAVDDGEVATWRPGQPLPKALLRALDAKAQLRAHNAGFDRLIWRYILTQDHGAPEVPLERWYCTAAQARANCAPGSLEDVGRFASADMRKDHRGKALIRKLCIPPYDEDPALMAEFIEYGEQDVRTMRAVSEAMRELSPEELTDYHVNERINDRGVKVDVALARAAMDYAAAELTDIQATVRDVTEGVITSVRSPKMRQWVQDRVGPEALKLMTVHKDGEAKVSIDKNVRANLLALADENPDEVPPDVAEVIQCADDLWASSVAKFERMTQLADEDDDRVRGAFVFAGGSATGRASSYGLQVHNYPRKTAKAPADVRQAMVRRHAIVPAYGARVTDVLKAMLRPALIPEPGNVFVVFDWSSIEARVNPWLAGCEDGRRKLALFATGADIYIDNAYPTFSRGAHYVISNDQRQVGKVAELASGFSGGVGAFAAMGRIYGVRLPEHEAQRTVTTWRQSNQWAVNFWSALEGAYRRAMRNPGREFTAGRITYLYDGTHLWYALPSGRILCYPYARFEGEDITYAKASWKPAADATEWPRGRLWRGLACENVTQATANDILRAALRQLDNVVLHVHDEIVVECAEADADTVKAHMHAVMVSPPAWATGLPLAAEGKTMARYGK